VSGDALQVLSNGILELAAVIPGATGTYRGTRFSWAGQVAGVTWNEHHLFGPWQSGPLAPDVHDNVLGTAGEFGMGIAGMPPPLGFEEAAPGGCFLKIGVGVLRRPDDEAYNFFGDHELVEAPAWEIEAGRQRLVMRQRCGCDGYGYDYTNTIELMADAPAFVIRHRLANTGTRPIRQTHYNHNFLVLDRQPVGPDYEITLPFTPGPAFGPDSDAVLRGSRLGFRQPLQRAVFAMLDGFEGGPADNRVTARHLRTGLVVQVTGDRPVCRYHFFAAPGAVCPEPFVGIHAAPGEAFAWEHRYELASGRCRGS
jgi:hypothetical protein